MGLDRKPLDDSYTIEEIARRADAALRRAPSTPPGINDMQRTIAAVKGAEGKQLTYQQSGRAGLPP
jgi:hypothetical protein